MHPPGLLPAMVVLGYVLVAVWGLAAIVDHYFNGPGYQR